MFLNLLAGGTTLASQVAAIFRKYGTDAHVYLPGIGVINGLTAGNYLDSVGTTAATVDNPVGLVLDGANSQLGSELVTNGTFDTNINGWDTYASLPYNTFEWASNRLHYVSNGTTRCIGGQSNAAAFPVVSGKAYKVQFTVTVVSGECGVFRLNQSYYQQTVDGGPIFIFSGVGTYTISKIVFATVTTNAHLTCDSQVGQAGDFYVDNVSIKEVTGIHALQATTANKPILRSASGKYHWVFDSTDLLTATFPAGYESATTIDARTTGHVTLTAQNIVGAYNIGPSIDTYGRFVFRTGLTASELATMQQFANRLAGV